MTEALADLAATTAMKEMQEVMGYARSSLSEQAQMDAAMEAEGLGRRAREEEGDGRSGKWPKQALQGKGSRNWTWRSDKYKDDWFQADEKEQAKESTIDIPTQRLITEMVKLTIRHEEELSKLRIDTTFFVYLDTGSGSIIPLVRQAAEVWNQQCEEGKVTTPLRVVLLMLIFKELGTKLLADEARREQAKQYGWLEGELNDTDPSWNFFQWNPAQQRQEKSSLPALRQSEVRKHMDVLMANLATEGALTKLKSMRPMSRTDRYASAVLPFMVNLSLRSEAATTCYRSLMMLVGSAALKTIGMRHRPERGHRQPQAQVVEKAYLAVPYTEWQERAPLPRRRGGAEPTAEEPQSKPPPYL